MSGVGAITAATGSDLAKPKAALEMLVGHDAGPGGDDAVALARLLGRGGADGAGSVALVVLVVPLGPREIGDPPLERPANARTWQQLCDGLLAEGKRALDRRTGFAHKPAGMSESSWVLLDDSPARALSAHAESEKPDLVVIGSTHRGKLGRLWPGATADRLLNGCSRPVAQAPRGYATAAPSSIERIGVGFDGSPESCGALALAADLAARHAAALQLIAIVEPSGFADREIAAEAFDALAGRGLHDRRAEALQAVAEKQAAPHRERGLKVRIDVAHGDPAEFLQTASRGAVDLLVVGSRRYGPVGRVLLGSVSSRVLRGAAAPVVVATR